MKRESQIRQKIKQVVYRHRKRFVQSGLKQKPENCQHNGVAHLPIHTGNRAEIRVCKYQDEEGIWNNRVCDSTMAGERQAAECPHFECCNTAEDLKNNFDKQLGLDGNKVEIGQVAKEYPELAALLWVLGTADEKNTSLVPDQGSGQDSVLAVFGPQTSESTDDH